MPKIYKRNCNICGKHYEGYGKYFCSPVCRVKREVSEETKRKLSKSWKRRNYFCSEETRKKMSIAGLGKIISQEQKAKTSQTLKKKFAKGEIIAWQKNKLLSKEHKQRIGNSMIGKNLGEKNWNWLGGISFEPYSTDWTKTLRRAIRERDNYTCQLCGTLQENRKHSVHHIDYDKKNCDPKNLITLCTSCNAKVNFNREYWTKYFYEKTNQTNRCLIEASVCSKIQS